MKLFKNTLYIIGAAAALASCNVLEQNSLSSFDAPSVYSDYTLSRYALNGVYEAYIVTRAYRSDYFMYYGANTDLEYWVSNGDDERSAICKYRVLPTNYYLNMNVNDTFYPALFNCIERANVCIHYLTEYGDVDSRPEMGELLGEALTLRALYYTDLLNMYGEVPARFEPVDHETLYVPKSDRDVIYKQLLKDLQRAATLMEFDSQTTRAVNAESVGRISPTMGSVSAGQLIVSEGEIITSDIAQILDSFKKEYETSVGVSGPRYLSLVGNILVALLLVTLLALVIYYSNKLIFLDNRYYYVLFVFALAASVGMTSVEVKPSTLFVILTLQAEQAEYNGVLEIFFN